VHPDHERERDEDDGPADRDRPERLRAEQVADPQRVDQLEEGLQEVREDDRPGEGCELAKRRPAGEVPPAPRHVLSSTLGDPRERTVTRPPTAASGAFREAVQATLGPVARHHVGRFGPAEGPYLPTS